MISIIVNFDSRPGWNSDESFIGQYGQGSLQGVRSSDFWSDGIKSIENYFSGTEYDITAVMDEVEPIPDDVSIADGHTVSRRQFPKNIHRYNDRLYIDSVALAKGEYVCHIDGDVSLFRDPNSNIVQQYLEWLDSGKYKFICQPTPLSYEEHLMDHASTRFFICKRESLNIYELYRLLDDATKADRFPGQHLPCLEHILGAMAGKGEVFYPPLDLNDHVIFSWVRYKKGLIKNLNGLPYNEVIEYINKAGLHGASDLAAI